MYLFEIHMAWDIFCSSISCHGYWTIKTISSVTYFLNMCVSNTSSKLKFLSIIWIFFFCYWHTFSSWLKMKFGTFCLWFMPWCVLQNQIRLWPWWSGIDVSPNEGSAAAASSCTAGVGFQSAKNCSAFEAGKYQPLAGASSVHCAGCNTVARLWVVKDVMDVMCALEGPMQAALDPHFAPYV